MAVGQGGEFLEEPNPPVAGRLPFDGELEGRFALSAAEYRRAREEPPAERHQLALAELAEPALQQHTQIVGGDRQVTRRLRRPEFLATQALDAELAAQLLDAIFNVRATIVEIGRAHV